VEKVVTAPRKSQPPANPPPPSTVLTDGMSTFDEKLFAFLLQHHAKSSRSDVNGLVADYGEKVDHFSHGIVDRAFIRKDELEYHAPGIKVTEEIFTRPNFSKIATNAYSANYSITYQRIHPDGGLTFIRCISWK
jgi:hypothetical protein